MHARKVANYVVTAAWKIYNCRNMHGMSSSGGDAAICSGPAPEALKTLIPLAVPQ